MFMQQTFYAFNSADVSVYAMPHMPGVCAELLHAQYDIEGLFLGDPSSLNQPSGVVAAQQENRKASNRVRSARNVCHEVTRKLAPDRLNAKGIS